MRCILLACPLFWDAWSTFAARPAAGPAQSPLLLPRIGHISQVRHSGQGGISTWMTLTSWGRHAVEVPHSHHLGSRRRTAQEHLLEGRPESGRVCKGLGGCTGWMEDGTGQKGYHSHAWDPLQGWDENGLGWPSSPQSQDPAIPFPPLPSGVQSTFSWDCAASVGEKQAEEFHVAQCRGQAWGQPWASRLLALSTPPPGLTMFAVLPQKAWWAHAGRLLAEASIEAGLPAPVLGHLAALA